MNKKVRSDLERQQTKIMDFHKHSQQKNSVKRMIQQLLKNKSADLILNILNTLVSTGLIILFIMRTYWNDLR